LGRGACRRARDRLGRTRSPEWLADRRRPAGLGGRRGATGWCQPVDAVRDRRAPSGHQGARMSVTTAPVEFDPFSEEFFNDPTEVYRRLRDEAPVYFNEKYGFYALSRFADVLAAHREWETFSSSHGIDLSTLTRDPDEIKTYRMIIMMDPPEHDRLRALVSRVFTPRRVEALEPMIREVIL